MGTNPGQRTIAVTGPVITGRTNPGLTPNKPGGITIDWSVVTTVGDGVVTATGGAPIPAGVKYIDVLTVMLKQTGGANAGLYGPANSAGANGLQTFGATRFGEAYLTDRLVLESEEHSNLLGEVFDRGDVFKGRLKVGSAGQPTLADLAAMFPGVRPIGD